VNDESRPKAAPEVVRTDSIVPQGDNGRRLSADDELDIAHRAWLVGWESGYIAGQKTAADNLARELLHRQACEMAGIAVREARERHGDGWAEEIRQAAS
jgi:hypothetical protein